MFELDFAARTDRGLVRETNQDVARVVPRLRLALVADGMGGHDCGDVASGTAAAAFEQSYERLGGPGNDVNQTLARFKSAVRDANRRVGLHPASRKGAGQMGTTLVAVAFSHGYAVIGHVGDSRCYRLRRALELLTLDHSLAMHMEASGLASSLDGHAEPEHWAHILTRCLNGDSGVLPDTRVVPCEPGDVFLLCSDGLWGAVSEPDMRAALVTAQDARQACDHLIEAAYAGGGHDNIGVAVVRLVPLQPRLSEPSWGRPLSRASEPPSAGARASTP